jgi:triacylglycerol lipase
MTARPALQNPIVLVHGIGAFGTIGPIEYFHGIPSLLRDAGNRVYIPQLSPWDTIERRATQLKERIEREFPDGEKVNLIAHSMGGLDCRYLASRLGFAERVASVTTIGTPHRGSFLADLICEAVPTAAGMLARKAIELLKLPAGGLRQLGTRHCNEVFHHEVPDAPNVAYFSATSAIPDPVFKHSLPVFWPTHKVLLEREGDNDGFVSVGSAEWGTHICTYRGDHYGQIGQLLGRSRGLDHMKFFEEITGRLRREGM